MFNWSPKKFPDAGTVTEPIQETPVKLADPLYSRYEPETGPDWLRVVVTPTLLPVTDETSVPMYVPFSGALMVPVTGPWSAVLPSVTANDPLSVVLSVVLEWMAIVIG